MSKIEILPTDNLAFLQQAVSDGRRFSLIYVDPPFNTGKTQKRRRTAKGVVNDELSSLSFSDRIPDYYKFLQDRLVLAKDVLTDNGSLFFHIGVRESHYCKVMLDQIFGRDSFTNEIIWSYDYGARSKKKWSNKHDVILWYAKDPKNYIFRYEDIDRIPYLAPGLVGPEKAARGKTPTDVWWCTIVPTNGKEKTGYPTQKPLKLLTRIVKVHSNPGDWCLDFFAGSGTFGEACLNLERNCVLVDNNLDAVSVMQKRLLVKA